MKQRIDHYLWRDKSMPVVRLREVLHQHFLDFDDIAIVGGLVRDFARFGQRGFRSDVDLVIHAPAKSVESLAKRLSATRNRFGGFGLSTPHWKIDFWALETTWAVTHGHATVSSLRDVAACTFFDCDAVLYDLRKRRIFARTDYFERLARNTIDINLAATPSTDGNLLRAIRRLLSWGAMPGERLSNFIAINLNDAAFDRITIIEEKLFANRIAGQFESADAVKRHLFDAATRSKVDTSYGEQLNLPGL